MFSELPGGAFAALVIALIPASLRWWWGRALVRRTDDPLIAERLAAYGTRVGATAGACAVLQVMGWPAAAAWTVPLQIVAQTAAAYPLRKALYGETWSLAAYLGFYARLTVGVFGFWLAVALTPWLAARAGHYDWIAAAALGLTLAAWNRYYGDVTRAILRAEPIADGPLLERFQALAARCGLPMPLFICVRMRGGFLANALALPSLRRSAVLFTDTLLARLTAEEAVAICAHELAHLEYYDRTRLRRLSAVNYVLIVMAAATAPICRVTSFAPDLGYGVLIWPVAMVIALGARARHRQRNETVSDLRAVELTGNAEALASGLTALYTMARVPRRLDQQRERRATHPSLARRLRDIRAAGGMSAAALETSATFQAASGAIAVTFEPAHVRWQENAGATHLLEYGGLAELRLHASPAGGITLVAVERAGRRWQMTPRAGDEPAMQSLLDAVDGRLAHETRPAVFSAAVTRLVTVAVSLLALVSGQIAVAFVAMTALASAAPAFLNAAGCAALVAAAVAVRDGSSAGLATAILLAGIGAALLALGWTRRTESSRAERVLLPVLAVFALSSVAMLAMDGVNPIRLHQAAQGWPAAVVAPVALAAACWTHRRRAGFRSAALAAAIAGVVTTTLGSTAFLETVGRDPFLIAARPVTWMPVATQQLLSFDLPFEVDSLRLSPTGKLAAVVRTEDEEPHGSAPAHIYVGPTSRPLTSMPAHDVVFIDDRRALVLAIDGGGADVRAVAFDTGAEVVWRERVPDIESGELSYRAQTNRWVLLGRDSAGRFVRAEGTPGREGHETATWKTLSTRGGWIQANAASGRTAFFVEQRYQLGAMSRLPWLRFAPALARASSEAHLWRVRGATRIDSGRSLLETSCVDAGLQDDRVVCVAFDGTRTRLVAIDPETGSISPLASIDGHFWGEHVVNGGWISGWVNTSPAAVRLDTGQAVRPPRVPGEYPFAVTATDAVIGSVASTEDGARVRLYPRRASD